MKTSVAKTGRQREREILLSACSFSDCCETKRAMVLLASLRVQSIFIIWQHVSQPRCPAEGFASACVGDFFGRLQRVKIRLLCEKREEEKRLEYLYLRQVKNGDTEEKQPACESGGGSLLHPRRFSPPHCFQTIPSLLLCGGKT